jgi:hypothetical protein
MENIIQFATVMFMLSIICERVAEFFKNYLCGKRLGRYSLVGDTLTKYPSHSLREIRRQYRVLKINLLIGFLTAFFCHASLFSILHHLNDPGKVIGWPNKVEFPPLKDWFKYVSFIAGCFLTGAFISLGSKFWHDLLDIVMEVKNTKRTVTEQRRAATSVLPDAGFATLPPEQQAGLIEAAIAANAEKWINTIPNVTGVGIGNKITANNTLPQKVIRFEVRVKENSTNPSELIPKTVTFGQYELPTDVVAADSFSLQYAHPGDDATPRKCGASVSRGNNRSTGTIALKVKRTEGGKEKHYLLTCAHVIMDDELNSGITRINMGDTVTQPVVISPGLDAKQGGITLGNLVEARVSNHTDSALVELITPQSLDERLYDIGSIGNKTRAVDIRDVDKTRVKFTGAFSGLVTDILVKGYGISKQGNYPSSVGHIMLNHLISIEKCSEEGDSGAVVLDENNTVIGLIVGASGAFTYVIPIQNIKSAHKQFTII